MKTHSTATPKPSYQIIITKRSGKVQSRYSAFKLRTLSFAKANYSQGDKIYVKVTYAPGFINEGEYTNWQDFRHAWEIFTEAGLIRDGALV